MKLFFRKVKYPILIESDSSIFGAWNDEELESITSKEQFKKKRQYELLDCTGEAWSYHPEMDIISPLNFKKRWTKKEIINFYNKFAEPGKEYVGKSLSAKRLSKIIEEIAELALPL